jgi:hypothetical protein
MSMPRVAVVVRMAGMAVAVIVAILVSMPGHEPILRGSKLPRPSRALIRYFDTLFAGMD